MRGFNALETIPVAIGLLKRPGTWGVAVLFTGVLERGPTIERNGICAASTWPTGCITTGERFSGSEVIYGKGNCILRSGKLPQEGEVGATRGSRQGAGILPAEDRVMEFGALAVSAATWGMAGMIAVIMYATHRETVTRSAILSYSALGTMRRVTKSFGSLYGRPSTIRSASVPVRSGRVSN